MAVIPLTLGTPKKITIATAGNAQAVTAVGADMVTFYTETNTGQYSNTGTDGAALGNDYQVLPPDTLVEKMINSREHGEGRTFYISADTDATVIRVLAEVLV